MGFPIHLYFFIQILVICFGFEHTLIGAQGLLLPSSELRAHSSQYGSSACKAGKCLTGFSSSLAPHLYFLTNTHWVSSLEHGLQEEELSVCPWCCVLLAPNNGSQPSVQWINQQEDADTAGFCDAALEALPGRTPKLSLGLMHVRSLASAKGQWSEVQVC